jgi:hypothetical protein
MLDIILAVILGAVMLLTAYLGVHVTLHPAESAKATHYYKAGFAACSIVACLLIGAQAHRTTQAQSALHAQLMKIEHNTNEPPKVQVVNQIDLKPLIDTVNSQLRSIHHENAAPSLKARALTLSSEILKMLAERKRSEPQPTHRYLAEKTEEDKNRIWILEGREYADAITRHGNETLAEYQEHFAPQVASLATELARAGVDIGELPRQMKYTLPQELPSVAANLASCAAQLPK